MTERVISEVVYTVTIIRIKCGYCGYDNYVSDNDYDKEDIEGILCWKCSKESLAGQDVADMYPDPEEALNIVPGRARE